MLTLKDIKQLNLPTTPGSYQFYNSAGKIIYVGKAVNLRSRVLSYWSAAAGHTLAKQKMLPEIAAIKWIAVDSEIEALLLEANLIKKYQPEYNILLRDDKRFNYIWISLDDEVPGVFLTRRLNNPGRYFGPFVSGLAVKETLKALRKIWPYCTQRKFSPQPCFYYQINKCTGVCGKVITREEYLRRVIKPIIQFLSGEKGKLIKNEELRIKNLGKRLIKTKVDSEKIVIAEELVKAKYQLRNFQQVLDNTRVLSTADKFASDVVELAKVLGLDKPPTRIEGYDISNLFGRDAVASLVTFTDGEPDKSGYKKFKMSPVGNADTRQTVGLVRSESKRGDTQMIKEVLTRRLAHADWPLPDLFIIDGGQAQLNAALAVLKKGLVGGWHACPVPMVIAISKGAGLRSANAPDKLFIAGRAAAVSLSLNSPALHLVKRVRDEAHRFAITYHRNLRSREMFKK